MSNKTRWIIIAVDLVICILNGIIGAIGLVHVGLVHGGVLFPINIFISGMFFSGCVYEVVIIFLKKQKEKYEAAQKALLK